MAGVRIVVPVRPRERNGHPRVRLVGESGINLTLPVAPRLTHDGLAPAYATQGRVGQHALMSRVSPSLRTYTYTLLLVGRTVASRTLNNQVSVEEELKVLRAMARRGERLRWVNFGPSEGGWFRLTSLSVADAIRQEGTNEHTVTEVSIVMTEASDAKVRVGPLTGGAQTTPAAPTPPAPGVPAAEPPEATGGAYAPIPGAMGTATTSAPWVYTVVSGDRLSAIALRFLGNAARYRDLADWNGIADPDTIFVGQRLLLYDPEPK